MAGALEGLDKVVRIYQTAFNAIRTFVFTIFQGILQNVENVLNSFITTINGFLNSLPDFIKDNVYNITGGSIDIKQGKGLLQELTFAKDFKIPQHAVTGLQLGDDIRSRISQGLHDTGQGFIDRGAQAFDRAQNVQVTNVNVEVGTHVGDDDELIRVVRQAVRSGRLTAS